ncbi:MAG: ABC transporter ATP-binding protein [Thermaerobacter sp.]
MSRREACRGAWVRVRDLTVRLGGQCILQELSCDVEPGQVVALVGPSGTGKSTLLRALAGLVPAAGGQVELRAAVSGRQARVAVMFQEPRLLPWLRVAGNVAFGLTGTALPEPERERRVQEALEAVGLADRAQAWPRELSGGMAQRAALARALVRRPDLLLLDEPFSAVDALTRMHLQDHLLAVWARHGFSAVLVTHDVDEAAYLADRIYVLAGCPAAVRHQVTVDVPRPRDRGDPRLAALRARLLALLAQAYDRPAASAAAPVGEARPSSRIGDDRHDDHIPAGAAVPPFGTRVGRAGRAVRRESL